MKERPILFSDAMVRALLAGTKTQTRRIVKAPEFVGLSSDDAPHWRPNRAGTGFEFDELLTDNWCSYPLSCPFGAPGDRMWVRECAALVDNSAFTDASDPEHLHWEYRADGDPDRLPGEWPEDERDNTERPRWHPSIHMPRVACRIVLDVTEIRVERLQDISESDAKAEGLPGNDDYGWSWLKWDRDPRAAYRSLWESINGAGSWDANPWVWVIGFKRAESA